MGGALIALTSGCGNGVPLGAASQNAPINVAAPMPRSRESVLLSFGGTNGAAPDFGLIQDRAGALYGTTIFGGAGAGLVFKLTPQSSGYAESVIYEFMGGNDGAAPEGVVMGSDGALYGATFEGGGTGNGGTGWGTIFKLARGQSGYTESVLYRFQGYPDAGQPNGPVVIDKNGSIFGSSGFGGTRNDGAVFEVAPSGSGYTESVIHSFPGYSGGQEPQAGVAIDTHGNVYGTTMYGGSDMGICGSIGGCGIVFKVTRGASGYSEKTIYAFKGNPDDGSQPYGVPTVDNRTAAIYGTTYYGGTKAVGTVFKLAPKGSVYTESLLHSFLGRSDGFLPQSGLLVERDETVYGTASLGGGGCHGIGCGTVYQIKPSKNGYVFHVLLDFQHPIRGADPELTNVINDGSGAILGTTRSGGSATDCYDGGPGGARGCGVVFRIKLAD